MVHIILGGTVFTKKYLPVYPKKHTYNGRAPVFQKLGLTNVDIIYEIRLSLKEMAGSCYAKSQRFSDDCAE
jgi:hypothetical protein